MKVKSESEVTQSCPTLSNPMDCSLPGSSVHGIFQARVLEWVAIAFSNDKPRQRIKKQRHCFADKGPYSQAMVFPVVMYGCDSWTIKLNTEKLMLSNCGAGKDSLESPLDCMEIKPVNPKGHQL